MQRPKYTIYCSSSSSSSSNEHSSWACFPRQASRLTLYKKVNSTKFETWTCRNPGQVNHCEPQQNQNRTAVFLPETHLKQWSGHIWTTTGFYRCLFIFWHAFSRWWAPWNIIHWLNAKPNHCSCKNRDAEIDRKTIAFEFVLWLCRKMWILCVCEGIEPQLNTIYQWLLMYLTNFLDLALWQYY